jgi:cation diffusion facilitator CzcD-associated flavoprotein CzcO
MGSARIIEISRAPDPGPIPPSDAPHGNSWYNQRDFDGYRITEAPLFTRRPLRVVCVGAGAAGLQLAYKASRGGLTDVALQIYERADDIGGTWLVNRYPGCACDIPSHSYQFAWARNPNWSAYYSPSAEIWDYLKDVAARHDLERYVRLRTAVTAAEWDDDAGQWCVRLLDRSDGGEGVVREDRCDVLISATGILDSWKFPDIPGLDLFHGKLMHSARWDHSFEFNENIRVAVVGGGSSAVQIIPELQPKVKKLTAFLRSPVWVTTGFGAKHAGPGGTNFKY